MDLRSLTDVATLIANTTLRDIDDADVQTIFPGSVRIACELSGWPRRSASRHCIAFCNASRTFASLPILRPKTNSMSMDSDPFSLNRWPQWRRCR
jgi:hypothetical protein